MSLHDDISSDESEAIADGAEELRALQDKQEREREELLTRLASDTLPDVKTRVASMLNLFPQTRNSDVELTIQYWRSFHPDVVGGSDFITFADLKKLTPMSSIERARRKVQNQYKLFLASDEVRRRRAQLASDERESQLDDMPGAPISYVYCDETGKTGDTYIVAGVWLNDAQRLYELSRALSEFRKTNEVNWEFHFADLSPQKVDLTIAFMREVLKHTDVLGFKAVLLRRADAGRRPPDDAIYRLHHHFVTQGIAHEIQTRRAALPRAISLTKDADEGADKLYLLDLKQRLRTDCDTVFKKELLLKEVVPAESRGNHFVQVADLFAGSLARVLNRKPDGPRNHKDRFAEALLQMLGVGHELSVAQESQDFVALIRI